MTNIKTKLFNIAKLIFALAIFFFSGDILVLILSLFNFNIKTTNYAVIFEFILSLIVFSVLLILYKKDVKEDFKKFKKDLHKNIMYIIKLFFIFMAIKYAVALVSAFLLELFNFDILSSTSQNQMLVQEYIKASPILMFIVAALMGPIYEELLFRLGFKKVFNKGIIFVLVSGFVFGLAHIFPLDGVNLILGIIQSISYVTMGLFLAYIYNKEDNIFYSIGVHFLNNFISILIIMNML